MKKITKAAIVGTVGAALLVGGAGSLAFWTDSSTGPQVEIQSGQLDLGSVAAGGTWTIQQNATGVGPAQAQSAVFDPANDLIVPGDVLTTTVNVPVVLEGKNLKAELAVDVDSFVAGTSGTAEAKAALAAALAAGTVKVVSIDGVDVSAGDPALILSGPDLNRDVAVKIAVTFPWGDAATSSYNAAMLGSVQFQANYTLTQIAVATP